MRSKILTQQKSSPSEKNKFNILVNELVRRFEVLDDDIDLSEKIATIDHFTEQLVKSGYKHQQAKDKTISGLKGAHRKCERR